MASSHRRLPGDLAIWFFILAEMLAFAVFFAAYAFARTSHLEEFNLYQQTLDRNLGAINTLLAAVRSVLAGQVWLSEALKSSMLLRLSGRGGHVAGHDAHIGR